MSEKPAILDAVRRNTPLSQIDAVCDRFEKAWKAGRQPRIEDYLSAASAGEGAPPRRELLIELVIIDMEYRWRRARDRLRNPPGAAGDDDGPERPPQEPAIPALYVEDYVARYPELGPLNNLPEDLVAHEHRVRQHWSEPPSESLGLGDVNGCVGEFKGTQRFAVERRVGAGGMGVVYQAYDHQRKEIVAIKTVRNVEARTIYRLKQEFRALADLVHPNLVTLHELFCVGGQWFFTMEYVRGADFLRFVRSGRAPGDADPAARNRRPSEPSENVIPVSRRSTVRPEAMGVETDRVPSSDSNQPDDADESASHAPLGPDEITRLRAVLKQIAEGVSALHRAGKLHRDVKPSNVLVTHDGRVVLLDFGLTTELERREHTATTGNNVVGSVPYMSPEQAAGKRLSPASDWYSVGVMLYEALTGRQPFRGRALDVLSLKQEKDPPPPSDLVAGVPLDLNWLAMALLRRDPVARPSGDEVLRRLGSAPSEAAKTPLATSPPRQAEFVGREEHLNVLNDALRVMQRRRTVVAYVHGPLGVGKTTLIKQFLDQLRRREETVVLAGRCHESESVPYKALDSIVDALSHYLVRLPRLEAEALLPRDVDAVSRVFPVLRRVEAVADSPRMPFDVSDPQELRQRAVDGLRELLARLGDRKTLVLSIDDLHWGDLDSVAMLSDLLRPPSSPVLLLLVCYRTENRAASPMTRAILDLQISSSQHVDVCELEIEPLSDQEARQLASALIGADEPGAEKLSEAIARESGGSPYFLEALVRHQEGTALLPNGSLAPEVASLNEMLWERVKSLPDPARRLLETVAIAGHPVRQADAFEATGLSREGHDALGVLRMANMIHVGGESLRDEIQVFDERVRRTVASHLTPEEAAECHQRLARALEASGRADPATIAAHYVGADDTEKAGRWYAVAAEDASDATAFDNAAELYRLALQLSPMTADDQRECRRRLADCLAAAGRGAEAAEEYLRAAGGAGAAEALQLRRSAATQFLASGHVDEGLEAIRTVLAAVGIKLPKTRRRAVLSLWLRRLQVRLRGVEFRERDSSHMPPKDLWKIDVCWSAALGLSSVDTVTAAAFQARHLLLALRAGEPYRISRALALEAVQVAIAGGRAGHRAERYLEQAMALARRVDNPHAQGVVSMASGIVAWLKGRWARAVELADKAEKTFRESCTGVAWELETARACALWALCACGAVDELSRRLPLTLPDGEDGGGSPSADRADMVTLPRLAANDPDGAERDLGHEAAESWEDRFHLKRFHRLLAHVQIDLYRGDGRRARDRITDAWRSLNRSYLLRVQLLRVMVFDALGRAALLAAADAEEPQPFLRSAEQQAKRLRREKEPWVEPLAETILAAVAASQGRRSRATTLLRDAISRFDALNMSLRAACARRRLGELIGGPSGASLVEETDSWMAGQRIVSPARMATLYAPGFPAPKSL